MAASRRGQPQLSVRLPGAGSPAALPDLPPISALFLIDFDVKAGYTIVWKQALPGIELEGTVEYKSLPSGLHTVSDDLIYFVHDGGHAGLSAFVNTRTDEAETRHARMIAVGVLVPLSYGRLGRAWRHAESLKDFAAQLVQDRKQTQILEEYWEQTRARDTTAPQPLRETPLSSPSISFKSDRPGKGHTRSRSASDGTALIPPGHRLSPFHPAWSLTDLLDTFGPLIFPIHRAALLRQRILISTHAPVHEICNFVYDISILSNIPLSVSDLLDPAAPAQRLRPLFTIGVHDIPALAEYQAAAGSRSTEDEDATVVDESDSGWVACTTDSILAMKEDLWDMLITMPPPYAPNAREKVWPTVEYPKGHPVKATQRDLRRFRSLKAALSRLQALAADPKSAPEVALDSPTSDPSSPASPAFRLSTSSRPGTASSPHVLDDDVEKIVEPTTWAALAYHGFMWWASAGEQHRGGEQEEAAQDASLLADLAAPTPERSTPGLSGSAILNAGGLADSVSSLTARRISTAEGDSEDGQARVELAIIAYFHRLTTSLITVLSDIVDSSDDDDLFDIPVSASGDEDDLDDNARLLGSQGNGSDTGLPWVRVNAEAITLMGLDVWSHADAEFVKEVASRYFARRAYIETKRVEVCGVRVC